MKAAQRLRDKRVLNSELYSRSARLYASTVPREAASSRGERARRLFALGGQFGELVHRVSIAFARGRIEQNTSLLAAPGDAFSGNVQIGEWNCRGGVAGLKRAPKPFGGGCRILRNTGAGEILLRAEEFGLRGAFRKFSRGRRGHCGLRRLLRVLLR